ncbi:MAG: periplasmic protein TonB [Acidobacteriota bacterium]|nr:periplasmic protein TonB [Acidobacteriota bacterium]
MPRTSRLLFALLVVVTACAGVRAQSAAPTTMLATARTENDRDRDGLQGPVRRVRTENAKLVSKGGQLVEGARSVVETATYDMKGSKIDTAYFLSAGGALTGKEVYKYDDKGDIVEMTLFNTDGSVLSKEKYDYEFDAVGNWTKMLTSVAVIENGKMSFEPTEVTYRVVAYFLEDNVAKKLQQGAPVAPVTTNASAANATNANAANANANVAKVNPVNVPTQTAKSQQGTPAPKQPAALPAAALLSKSQAPEVATLNAPNAPVASGAHAPVVKTEDDLPPPARAAQAPLRPVSGGVLNGKAISLPAPAYPELAKRAHASGTVTVEVVIDVSGRVISAKALSGPELLRETAERAAMQAKFTPALLSGQPTKVVGTINYNFTF